jgi:hypothetical protein
MTYTGFNAFRTLSAAEAYLRQAGWLVAHAGGLIVQGSTRHRALPTTVAILPNNDYIPNTCAQLAARRSCIAR